jgi:hypothetical protein
MITMLLHLLRLYPFLCGGHRQLALENLALRHQLAVYKRTVTRNAPATAVPDGGLVLGGSLAPRNVGGVYARTIRLGSDGAIRWDRVGNADLFGRVRRVHASQSMVVLGGCTDYSDDGQGPAWLASLNASNGADLGRNRLLCGQGDPGHRTGEPLRSSCGGGRGKRDHTRHYRM